MTDTATATETEVALLAATAREFFAGFADNGYLNRQQESALGYDAERWRQIVDLGWTAVSLPERVGGAAAGIAAAAAVAVEFGRAAVASPWLPTLRAATVLQAVAPAARIDPMLSAVAAGVPHALAAPADRTVRATVDPDGGLRLAGPPIVVEWAQQCDTTIFLVPVANDAAAEQDSRWAVAAVPRDRLGERRTAVISVDNERAARIEVAGLVVPAEYVLADDIPGPDAEYALAAANLLRAAVMVGGCEAVLEFSVRYARERIQFGQPIGNFQAVRHHLSRMAIAADAARLSFDEALSAVESPERDRTAALLAVFVAGRSYVEIVLTAAQIHGGVGTTVEHVLHHHFRRAKAAQLRAGKRANRLRELTDLLVRNPTGSLW
ncbi:acyl-CoA dehydrogenase family protein [Nocardia sp. BMG111209]|uniref:acyl-CoA dehydrogenase family protein n=1 Tax=Nocardia sp. BMG111209 TaxID=1160137 RepID=UPI0003625726|nr:acyl-CoA dehydrogenase family protein [Nocardia sp. BMG111209]